jgi:hypothetical protein
MASCEALPGTETLLEAVRENGRAPALVVRQFGAGRVAYMAFDETWRWRQNVAEKYQERFWNQLIPAIAEPVFASQDDLVSLDTDAFSYRVGATAEVRARIRSVQQSNRAEQAWKAVLWRDGKRVASIPLAADENRSDVLRGRTAALEAGSYSLGLEGSNNTADSSLRVSFQVATPSEGELAELTLNEDLLGRMSAESKGVYLREEKHAQLQEALTPLETGRIVETETVLWQSYWWFSSVLALLSLEWLLRKRAGLL